MKTTLTFLLLCFVLFSCKEDKKDDPIPVKHDGYIISGTAPGLFNGLRAYLKSTDDKGRLKAMDTAIIMNETFVFDGKVELPEAWYLEINSLDGSFPFVIDNSQLTITVDKDDIKQSLIQGDSVNNIIADYNAQLNRLNDSLKSTSERYRQMVINKESVTGMSKDIAHLKDVILRFPHQFIQNNPDNPYGLVLLNTMIRRNALDKGLIVTSYDTINDELKNSNLGKRVAKSIPEIRKQYAIIAATDVGKVAPDFSAPNPNGKIISLSDIKGKAVLIHFWSSWFKASRRENTRLVKLYETYHDKGLEMIGVSLDGNSNQTNPKSDWKNAIKEDQLVWDQISNLNYFNDTISKAYNVRSLPSTFLLNDNGVIIAKNITGTTLESEIKALLE